MRILKSKLITCILPKGKALEVLKLLKKEKGITTANINHARGIGTAAAMGAKGQGQSMEKDVLTVVVPEKDADETFEFLFDVAEINVPHGGFMYQTRLHQSVPLSLPEDIPEES